MICQYQTSMDKTGRGKCALGFYGGHPWTGNCISCIGAGQNTIEHAAALAARYERSHPKAHRGISGCCDRADLR